MKQTNKVDWLLLLLQFKEMLLQQTVEVVSQLSKLQRVRQNKSCDIYGNAQVFSKPGNRNAFLKMPSRTELLLPDCNMALIPLFPVLCLFPFSRLNLSHMFEFHSFVLPFVYSALWIVFLFSPPNSCQ